MAIVLALTFLFDNLRENRSVPLTKEPGIAYFKNSCGTPVSAALAGPFRRRVKQELGCERKDGW